MKKKLLVLLLIAALSIFVFAGCDGLFPSEGEGEGEGEGELKGVVVEIEDAVKINGIDYVAAGKKDITVTFPAPVEGYVKAIVDSCTATVSSTKVLFPNEDRTVWTGTVDFDCKSSTSNPCGEGNPCGDTPCCETIITIESGTCKEDACIVLPVIVDCEAPAIPDFEFKCYDCNPCDECVQEGIYFTFKSLTIGDPCDPEDTCYDDCSGVAEWKFTVGDVCDECILAEGTGCPIEGQTVCGCLPYKTALEVLLDGGDDFEKDYIITFTIKDKVGNEAEAYYKITVDTEEVVHAENGECVVPVS